MSNIWRNNIDVFECSKQRLADQVRTIKVNRWLSDLKKEELRRKIDQCGASNEQMTEVTPENHGDITITTALYNLSLKILNRVRMKTIHTAVSIGSKMHRDGLDDEYINLALETNLNSGVIQNHTTS